MTSTETIPATARPPLPRGQQRLAELCDSPQLFTESAHEALTWLATLGEKLPLAQGLDALVEAERVIFSGLEGESDIRLSAAPTGRAGESDYRVFLNGLGRLHIRPVNDPLPDYGRGVGLLPVGFVGVPDDLVRRAARRSVAAKVAAKRAQRRLDRLLAAEEAAGGLDKILDRVEHVARRIEAVCVYVGDELFSATEGSRTLAGTGPGEGLVGRLRGLPLRDWTPAARLAVGGLYTLSLTGFAARVEEFNGRQLTAKSVVGRVAELEASYARFALRESAAGRTLFERARSVGRMAAAAEGTDWVRYRAVNGTTFVKTEHLAHLPAAVEEAHPATPRLHRLHEEWLGWRADPDAPGARVVDSLAAHAVAGGAERVESLIREIVNSAVVAAAADYGMSSGPRDLAPFVVPLRERPDHVLALKPDGFFCCVVAKPGFDAALGAVVRLVQGRMQYNRWHFVAGNLPEHEIPPSRHFYYPPTLPDCAEWSDLRHAGHTRAGVRYSIRVPGPDASRPPLMIAGQPYRGFYDVRVVRTEGPPFGLVEMAAVRRHCLWLGVLWRHLVARAESGTGGIAIGTFPTDTPLKEIERWEPTAPLPG